MIERIRGIHPGVILRRELKSKGIKGVELAHSINEYPQTLNAVMKGRRGLNPKLSVKLGRYFNVVEDYFMLLQASYDVKLEIESKNAYGEELAKRIRPILFWDTDISKIDWMKNRRSIIKRLFERGNNREIKALISFYGLEIIREEIKKIESSNISAFSVNIERFIMIRPEKE